VSKSRELIAVFDEDLASVLRALGLLEALEHGDLLCAACGTVLSLRNLSGFIPQHDGTLRMFCDQAGCAASVRDGGNSEASGG
jgi:hypothetical protein